MSVLDVGARWGSEGAWYRIPPLAKVVGFEPDPVECKKLNDEHGSEFCRFVPIALGDADDKRPLHVTRDPACSSLYPPNKSVIKRYPTLEVMSPESTIEVPLRRLDSWVKEDGIGDIRFIKLDVQGAELDVIKGSAKTLEGCLGLDVEVEFFPLYEGQPLFADIDIHLRAAGFSLWRLNHLVHYCEDEKDWQGRHETAVYANHPRTFEGGSGRLAWGHALYLRDYATFEDKESLLTLASLLDACGDYDGALSALRSVRLQGADEVLAQKEMTRLVAFAK